MDPIGKIFIRYHGFPQIISVSINIIIDHSEHKNEVIKPLTGIENVTIRIRQLSIGDYQVDKRLIVDMINVVYDKTIR